MACLNMQHKNETQGGLMGPRISFSNDFIDSNIQHQYSYTEAPVSSDFEFSVPTFSSNAADEAFFKAGYKLPPLKEKVVTLRDELLAAHDDDDDDVIFFNNNNNNNNKNSTGWWKEKLGLRKSSQNKNLGGLETIDETKIKPTFYNPTFTGSNRYK